MLYFGKVKYMEDVMKVWKDPLAKQFAGLLYAISDIETLQEFLRDVMTENEIKEISARFRAAQMLRAGKTYGAIIKETGLSSRTIARISEWMSKGAGGYEKAFSLHHNHVLPVSS